MYNLTGFSDVCIFIGFGFDIIMTSFLVTWSSNLHILWSLPKIISLQSFSYVHCLCQVLKRNNDVMMASFGILGFKISISCKPGYKLLKYLAEPISESLSLIVNEPFLNGIYLDKLKTAKVVALHKKGASDNPTNYRPISLLSVFSEIIGKLVHKRLYDFLELSDVIHPLQFGFRTKSILLLMYSLVLLRKLKRQLMMVIMGVEFSLTWKKLLTLLIMIFYWKSLNTMAYEVFPWNGLDHT